MDTSLHLVICSKAVNRMVGRCGFDITSLGLGIHYTLHKELNGVVTYLQLGILSLQVLHFGPLLFVEALILINFIIIRHRFSVYTTLFLLLQSFVQFTRSAQENQLLIDHGVIRRGN